ncbi:MAG: flavin reductase family protein [Chloroflexi bacterium]|nr:flavin reductase family protein [Chloroflexota bacterium]
MNASLDPTDFRDAMARFASGVTVVTTRDGTGKAVGFTASAFSSLSLDPPLLLVCLQKDADCYAAFMEAEQFGVSILAQGQSPIAIRFATKAIDKWEGTPSEAGSATGIPLIGGAAARLECRTQSRPDGGDHTILIGEVLTADANGNEPLLHFNRSFGRFVEDAGA